MSDPHYSTVLLDAGGVLLLPDPRLMREELAVFGVFPDDAECHRAFYHGVSQLDRRRLRDWRMVDDVVARAVGVGPSRLEEAAERIGMIYQSKPWVSAPRADQGIRRLLDAGVRVGVVTNSDGTMGQQLVDGGVCSVEECHLPRVAAVVDSGCIQKRKPDGDIFLHALRTVGASASDTVYVGDSITFDVDGARAAGIAALHFDPFGLCSDRRHEHVRSMEAL